MLGLGDEFDKDIEQQITDVKETMKGDMDLVYEELVAIVTGVEKTINRMTHDYEMLKHTLKIKKLDLKYSNDYKQFKTIKEKEERAELETASAKLQVQELEYEIEQAKTIRRYYERLMEKKL